MSTKNEHDDTISGGISRRDFVLRASSFAAAAALPASLLTQSAGAAAMRAASAAAPSKPSGTINWLGMASEDTAGESRTMKDWLYKNNMDFKVQYFAGPPIPSIIQTYQSGAGAGIDLVENYQAFIPSLNLQSGGIKTFFQPIDTAKIPNFANLIPQLAGTKRQLWAVGGKLYMVPVRVSANALVWSSARVPTPPTSWADLLSPQFKGRLAFITAPNSNYGLASVLLNAVNEYNRPLIPQNRLNDAIALFQKVVANAKILTTSNGSAVNALAAGDVDAIWNGYPELAVLANAANPATKASYQIFPTDGNILTVEGFSIGADADNVDAAYAFINEALAPHVQADYSNYALVAPAVSGADKYLEPAVLSAFASTKISSLLKRYPQPLVPPVASTTYVTQAQWTSAFGALTS